VRTIFDCTRHVKARALSFRAVGCEVIVDFSSVECRSAFELSGSSPVSLPVEGESAHGAVQLTELRDILYLPNVLEPGQSICLATRRIVPQESILDCWTAEFFKERHRQEQHRHTYSDDFEVASHRGTVCVLGNVFSRSFGHWTEEMLKVAVLEAAHIDCAYVIPTLPSFAREFLLLLGVGEHRVLTIDRPTVFERAIFTTAVHHENVQRHPAVLFQFRDLVRSRLTERASRYGPRLWLERGALVRHGGVTVNREEVYRLLERYDFEVVDMATLPLADQLRTAQQATMMAGPHGSQFVHAQFMPMRSTVIECFSPIHVNPSILQICRVLGHDYHQIVSRCNLVTPYVHGRDCQVDCDHLALVLDVLTAASA
jgi:capsular polysaccharide biosynthesis protein